MKIAFVSSFLLATTVQAHAQSMLSGKVLTQDSAYVPAAYVALHDAYGTLKAETVTDSLGGFTFRIGTLQHAITLYLSVSRIGYATVQFVPVSIAVSDGVNVRIHLSPEAVSLRPITAEARSRSRSAALDDYYDKVQDVKRGVGRVLDRTVMERYAGLELVTVLGRLPGVQQGRAMLPSGVGLTLARMSDGCVPLTFLDRSPILPEDLATLNPGELEGVLVYVGGSQLPADFSRLTTGAECGLILAYRVAESKRRIKKSPFGIAIVVAAYAAFVLANPW